MLTMRSTRCFAAAILLPLLAACGGDSSTAPRTVAGTWELQTVGGAPLPFLLYQTSSAKTELVGAVIEMAETGTYTEALLIRATQSTGQASSSSIPYAGSYTLSGTAITFKDNNGGQSPGSW